MSENLQIDSSSKEAAYRLLVPQIESLMMGESNIIANLANISSAIQMTFSHLWVGFYIKENDQLVLGPFQGPIACTRIQKGQGVCGTAWKEEKTMIVADVNLFDGHIACSSDSVSEIVVPLFHSNNNFFGVLDIDSTEKAAFDTTDAIYLEKIAQLITNSLS
jgi:GAF domain-containing protein